MSCPFSQQEVALQIDPTIPVECPTCGAIRKIHPNLIFEDGFSYPIHTHAGFPQLRKRYRRGDTGRWDIWDSEKE